MTTESVKTSNSTASEMVAAQTESEVKAGFALAQHCPRNEERARSSIIMACKNLRFAEKSIYRKPIGKTHIEGPSIRFAEEMLRHWGNVKIQEIIIFDSPETRIVRVICYDLQTNLPYGEDVIIQKTVERKYAGDRQVLGERLNSRSERVFIVVATEDEIRNKEKAAVSKAIRNNGLRLIPAHIVEEAMDTARSTLTEKVSVDPMAVKRKMIDSFALMNINVEDLETYLKHPIDKVSKAEVAELQTVYNSIRDGEAKWSDFLAQEEPKKAPASADLNAQKEIDGLSAGDPSTHTPVDQPQKTEQQVWDESEKGSN